MTCTDKEEQAGIVGDNKAGSTWRAMMGGILVTHWQTVENLWSHASIQKTTSLLIWHRANICQHFQNIFGNFFLKLCMIRWEDWELEYVSELWQICENSLPLAGGGGRWSMFQSFDKVQNASPNFSGSNSRESSSSNVISSVAIKSNASWCIKDWDSIKTFLPLQPFGTEQNNQNVREGVYVQGAKNNWCLGVQLKLVLLKLGLINNGVDH